MKYVLLLALVGFAAAQQFQNQFNNQRPFNPQTQPPRPNPKPINPTPYNKNTRDADVTIVRQYFDELANGAANWGFQNSDGTERQEQLSFKPGGVDGPILVKEGFYTYYDLEGKLIKVSYRADENGFVILEDNRIVAA